MYAAEDSDDDAAHPGWGADPRLLQYRAAPPPRDDPTAIRGTLPAFGAAETRRENRNAAAAAAVSDEKAKTSPSDARRRRANQPAHPMYPMRFSNSTQHNAHALGDPARVMPDLPEHTKRLLFAQAMLNNQRALNDECERLIAARRVDLLRRRGARAREALEARAREEELARRAAEVDASLGDAERAMNARRGFRNVARHLSSMRNLGLKGVAPKKETEPPGIPGIPEKRTFAQARREAQANALATARRDSNGYVDLRPEPPLPPVPALLSLEKNPVVPDEKHVYALKKRMPGKAACVREAVLAAAAVAGDDAVAARPSARTARDDIEAFARAYDDDELPDAAPEAVQGGLGFKVPGDERGTPSARGETYVRYRRRKPHSRWEGVRDDSGDDDEDDPRDVRKRERDRLEAAVETHAARLERDAAAASSAGKFTKAEHYLRQLVALRVAGGDGQSRQSRVLAFGAFVGTVTGTVTGTVADAVTGAPVPSPADDPPVFPEDSETRSHTVDPVGAARALALLARAVRAQRNPRRVAETAALFGRAAAAIAAENGDDDAGVAADSDAEASTRLAALDGLSAMSAALDSKQGDRDALRYARRALAYAEKRFGPWDTRVARAARRAAARWLRVGSSSGGDGDGQRELPGSSSGGGGEAESAGVATATAIDLLRDALEVTEKALGKNHASAIETMCELAAAHKRAGDFPRARRLDEERRARRRAGDITVA